MPKQMLLLSTTVFLLVFSPLAFSATAKALPTGFADINLLDPWDSVDNGRSLQDLNTISSDWERFVSECGYRSALHTSPKGKVLITANDFQVTSLSFSASIKPGSNLMAVANQVIAQYGQPKQATMRDSLGTVTIDPNQVQHVHLSYDATIHAEFSVSGAPLWEYRIMIRNKSEHQIENKTLRCARKLSKEAKKNPPKKTPG